MKRTLAMLLAVVMMLAMFGACSSKEKENTAGSGTTGKSDNQGNVISGSAIGGGSTDTEISKDTVHPSDDATLKVAFHCEPAALTQAGHPFGSNMNHLTIFADCLLGWDSSTGTSTPNIATSWEWIDDLTLRLKLREDVTSINGDPFTADDVIYTWNWNNETGSLKSYYSFFDYENTKAVDDYTVDLAVKEPYPFLLIDLAHYAYAPVCEASVEAIGGKDATTDNPNAQLGPYKLVKWDAGQCVYAERRDDYWGTMPYYKYMELWTVTDATTRAFGVESGDYQVAINPSVTSAMACDGNPAVTGWFTGEGGAVTDVTLGFNADREPLNIKEVRQAIALAINYESLVKIAVGGNGVVSNNALVAPTSQFYTEPTDPSKNYIHYDPEMAKQLLTEAGYADGFTINCKYRSGDSMLQTTAEMLQNQLKEVGVILDLVPQESATWSADLRNGDFDTKIGGGGNPNPKRNFDAKDPRSDHNATTGHCGAWYPDTEALEELIDRCLKTIDETERVKAFTEFNDICGEYVPAIYLYGAYKVIITSSDIIDFSLISMGAINLKTAYPAEYIAA